MNKKYIEYIKSKKWKTFRRDYFKKFKKECYVCGATKNIHLHHKTYKNFMDEKFEDVIPLCEHCHKEIHRLSKYATDEYKEVILNKFKNEHGGKYKNKINKNKNKNKKILYDKDEIKNYTINFLTDKNISYFLFNNILSINNFLFFSKIEINFEKITIDIVTKDTKFLIRIYDIKFLNKESFDIGIKKIINSKNEVDINEIYKKNKKEILQFEEKKYKKQKKKMPTLHIVNWRKL